MKDLPQYTHLDHVHALEIEDVRFNPDGTVTITPKEEGYTEITVEAVFVPLVDPLHPPVPQSGDFLVIDDATGHKSFVRPDDFEEGYQPATAPAAAKHDAPSKAK